ncbi:helix-turn-helix transcriptional regulator (plasmid) [Bacillus sp. N447-1]|uniref:helix-turn-helix domain-containing protein n=1 Tax=Bacillus sp. N447-1 TaxID=2789208 RepID=UPI001F61F905|nr:helix-turn-helix transcriptional regulator [Bacillus sp. N447-1]UNT71680.1 helix-turn-helix transcriptional regulator [Bacillus sp. N447-1]
MNSALFQEIQRYMKKREWNKTQLSKKSGIHISEISRILNHKQCLSLHNLNAITTAFGLSESTFYSYYVEECLNEGKHIDKRRSMQFLHKCAAADYETHVNSLIDLMLEEKSKTFRKKNLLYIFYTAETLFLEGKVEQALPLYEVIIGNELDRFSEKLAISYFKRFLILRMTEKGQHALSHLLEYLVYMPSKNIQEAYFWIMADFYRREEWGQVLHYAEILEPLATDKEYYGQAIMYKSLALKRLGASLKEVLDINNQYAQVNDFFADAAVGNRYVALLDFGEFEYADEYLSWLENRDDIYVGLPRILEAYVHLDRLKDAKKLIERFKYVIEDMAVSKEPWLKEKMYLNYRYSYALFQCESNQFESGINELLEVADLSTRIGNIEKFKKCLSAFWKYRFYATSQHKEKYTHLLSTGNFY